MARLLLFAALFAGCSPRPTDPVSLPDRESRRAALRNAGSFATVLSHPAGAEELAPFDVAILDPEPYEAEDIRALRQQGVLTLGYVNIGEVEAYRGFASRVDPAWILGENPLWPGHQFVDARETGWQDLVVNTVATRVVVREFDGLFLDMADVSAPSLFPETQSGVVALIHKLREQYPTHVLVMNRGLFLLDRVAAEIDGLLVEGVWARYDGEGQRYIPTPEHERSRLLTALNRFRELGEGAVFVIDYADTPELRAVAEAGARDAGIPIFVSTVDLAEIPVPPAIDVD